MYGTLQLQGDEVACPTSAGTASGFTDNNPDETLTMRFSNYGAADATIHYLNSAGVQIGMMTLRAGQILCSIKEELITSSMQVALMLKRYLFL